MNYNDIEKKVLESVTKHCGINKLVALPSEIDQWDAQLQQNLGLDSLDMIEMENELEMYYNIPINITEAPAGPLTMRMVVDQISKKL